MKDNILVAVYGTLRQGNGNHCRRLEGRSEFLSTEKIKGFQMRSLGGFPAISSHEDSEITVELYNVNKEVFKDLDLLEGYPNFYDRKQVETSHGDAWIYFIETSNPTDIIEHGDWNQFLSEKHGRRTES